MDKQTTEIKKKLSLDKAMKISVIFGVVLIAISVAYYFFYRPYQKNLSSKYCHQWATDQTASAFNRDRDAKYKQKFDWCMNEQGQ